MAYVTNILVMACIYGILAMSLNLTVGFTGLLNLGHAAFFAIGAYTSALLALAGVPFYASLAAGALAAAAAGYLIGIPTLKLRGDYLAIATLGFGEITRVVLKNWTPVTGGPMGLPGIPRASLMGFRFQTPEAFLALSLAILLLTYLVLQRLAASPFGRVLRGIRDDELAVLAMGKETMAFKLRALALGSLLAGVAGALFAHYITFIHPSSFTIGEGILILCMVVLGGMGSNTGALLGAFILVALPESLRLLGLPGAVAGPLRQLFFGLILVVLMVRRPGGLLGGS